MDAGLARTMTRMALVATAALGFAAPGVAQDIPEGQSCGGLVCDLGLFGHKVPKAAAPVAVPGPAAAEPVPPPTRTTAAPEPRKPVRKKARVAKTTAARPAREAVAPAAPAVSTSAPVPSSSAFSTGAIAPPPSFATAVASPSAAVPPTPIAAVAPPPVPITATPTRDEPVVLSNPYVYKKPLNFMFQSVDPSQGVQ